MSYISCLCLQLSWTSFLPEDGTWLKYFAWNLAFPEDAIEFELHFLRACGDFTDRLHSSLKMGLGFSYIAWNLAFLSFSTLDFAAECDQKKIDSDLSSCVRHHRMLKVVFLLGSYII